MPLKNAKHEAVVTAFVADPERIGWKAYKAVYPKSSQRAAETAWGRLLKNAGFSARIAELQAEIAAQVRDAAVMSQHEVLAELSKLGRSSIKKVIVQGDDSGEVIASLRDMPDDEAATIQELTVETYLEGHGDDAREVKRVKLKLHDKRGALSELRRHYEPQKHEHAGPGGGPLETKDVTEMSVTEKARRVAFLLMQAAAGATAEGKGT